MSPLEVRAGPPATFEIRLSKPHEGLLCPQCLMPLEQQGGHRVCPLDAAHDVSQAAAMQEYSPRLPNTVVLPDLPDASRKAERLSEMEKCATDHWIRELSLPTTLLAWLRDVDDRGFLNMYQAVGLRIGKRSC